MHASGCDVWKVRKNLYEKFAPDQFLTKESSRN
jgi:hypothetical protein